MTAVTAKVLENTPVTAKVLDAAQVTAYIKSVAVQTETPGAQYVIGAGLKYDSTTNTLSVDTSDEVAEDDTRPITSAAVYVEVGNINALLQTI